MNQDYNYDVALSFAGEDREYVEGVAAELKSHDIKVFYDEYEQVHLWGKDLYEHFHDIYSSKAAYCVIFISEEYSNKVWTTHERRSAQERALREEHEYILPARFDSTELPGLPSTVAYIDLSDLAPEDFANLILDKIDDTPASPISKREPEYRTPRQLPSFNPYEEANRFIEFLREELSQRSSALEEVNASLSAFNRGEHTCFRVTRREEVLFSMDVWMGGLSGDKGLSFHAVDGEIRTSPNSINAWANLILNHESEQVVLELHDLSLLDSLSGQEMEISFNRFVDLIWDRIINAVDKFDQ